MTRKFKIFGFRYIHGFVKMIQNPMDIFRGRHLLADIYRPFRDALSPERAQALSVGHRAMCWRYC